MSDTTPTASYPICQYGGTNEIYFEDLNGDGHIDIVDIDTETHKATVQFSKEDGGFYPAVSQINSQNAAQFRGLTVFGLDLQQIFSRKSKLPVPKTFLQRLGLSGALAIDVSQVTTISLVLAADTISGENNEAKAIPCKPILGFEGALTLNGNILAVSATPHPKTSPEESPASRISLYSRD